MQTFFPDRIDLQLIYLHRKSGYRELKSNEMCGLIVIDCHKIDWLIVWIGNAEATLQPIILVPKDIKDEEIFHCLSKIHNAMYLSEMKFLYFDKTYLYLRFYIKRFMFSYFCNWFGSH